jgi:hypothetical protein
MELNNPKWVEIDVDELRMMIDSGDHDKVKITGVYKVYEDGEILDVPIANRDCASYKIYIDCDAIDSSRLDRWSCQFQIYKRNISPPDSSGTQKQ